MMTSRTRLMATLAGKPVDRPAVNFYELSGFEINPDDPDPFNVFNGPTWRPLLEMTETRSDLIRMRGPAMTLTPGNPYAEFFTHETYMEGYSRFIRVTLRVGGREITSLTRQDPDILTVWEVEHPLKSREDLEAYLTLPDEVFSYNIDAAPLIKADEIIGDRGIVMVDMADPICRAAALFSMADFTVMAYAEPELFHALLEKIARYVYTHTEAIAKAFPGHLWRVVGPEYATEPYLPPSLFEDYVARYTGPLVKIIQKTGGMVRLHCHGRIRTALPHFAAMGVDAIDPIEPPPQGDVAMAWVRQEYGRQFALFGGIEISDIENMEPSAFAQVAARTVAEGTSGEGVGFCLMPTSAPYGREIMDTTLRNYEAMLLAVGA